MNRSSRVLALTCLGFLTGSPTFSADPVNLIVQTFELPDGFFESEFARGGNAKEILTRDGVKFVEGMTAHFDDSVKALEVKAPEVELRLVEAVVGFWGLLELEKQDQQRRKLSQKLRGIIFPKIDFKETPLSEALAILQRESVLHDPSLPEEKRGVRIVLDPSSVVNESGTGPDIDSINLQKSEPTVTLKILNAELLEVLRYTTSLASRTYYFSGDELRVGISDNFHHVYDLVTRIFPAPPDLTRIVEESTRPGAQPMDPFSDPVEPSKAPLPTVKTWMQSNGISFESSGSVIHDEARQILIVRVDYDNMDFVEALLLASVEQSSSEAWKGSRVRDFTSKLDSLVLDDVSFHNAAIYEIVNSLAREARLRDREGPVWERGVSLLFDYQNPPIQFNDPFADPLTESVTDPFADPHGTEPLLRRIDIKTQRASLRQILELICAEIGGEIVVKPAGVYIVYSG